jgi:hypothetical protein
MNQDQIKSLLLKLEDEVPEFHVIFSGKSSKKVDGLYKPEIAQIIIHNKNFKSENALIYTAIHEFAHHVQFAKAYGKVSCRAHTTVFWDIFHRLLFKAEKAGIYKNIFKSVNEFVQLTDEIKGKYLSTNGSLIKDFGSLLMKAMELCRSYDASFEDYVDREIGLHRNDAKNFIKTNVMNLNPAIGYENMKIAARVPDPEIRSKVEKAFSSGMSPDMVKAEFFRRDSLSSGGTVDELVEQKKRISSQIERLRIKLAELDQKISELRKKEK